MDVTERNFIEALALLRNALPTTTFASLDLEFTGLGDTRPSHLDTPAIRYATARADAEKFPPIQFGLSLFRRLPAPAPIPTPIPDLNATPAPTQPPPSASVSGDAAVVTQSLEAEQVGEAESEVQSPSAWQVTPFNFNVFPRAEYHPAQARYPHIDRIFSMQSSTVKFLLDHGIDFMKIFARGVSWLRAEHEGELRKHVAEVIRNKRNPVSKKPFEMGEKDGKEFKKWLVMFNDWYEEASKKILKEELPEDTGQLPICVLPYPKVSNRRVLFEFLRKEHTCIVSAPIETQEGMRLKLVLHVSEDSAQARREEAMREEVEEEVSRAVGFRLVIDALREAGVALVVHHGLMDMVKMYANFVGPLPEELADFKMSFGRVFPRVYDTRWMMQYLCMTREEVRKAIDADKARSMDEVVPTLRAMVDKDGKWKLPDVRTFVPTGKINRNGKTLGKGYVMEQEKGFEIPENVGDFDVDADAYGFGRYAVTGTKTFKHEAGFDAMGAGKLFILLLEIAGIRSEVNIETSLVRVQNKIYLGSCGGYQHIDIDRREADEVNSYFNQNKAVVVSGEWKQAEAENGRVNAYQRFRKVLKRLVEGSMFDANKSTFLQVGPTTMIALFEKKLVAITAGDKRVREEEEDLDVVVRNANCIGVRAERYEDVVGLSDSTLKKRKCV